MWKDPLEAMISKKIGVLAAIRSMGTGDVG